MGIFDGCLILTDLDGTFTSAPGVIPQENRQAVLRFMAEGGKFGYCTGRYFDFVENLEIKANVPCCTLNGALIEEENKTLYENPFEGSMREIVSDIKAKFLGHFQEIRECKRFSVSQFDQNQPATEAVYKYVFITDSVDISQKLAKYIKDNYGEEYETFRSWDRGTEILAKGSSKGACALKIKEMAGAERLYCIGDYENDISMIKVADIGFAPSNANEQVLKEADVILCDNINGAIKEMIDYIEKKKDA